MSKNYIWYSISVCVTHLSFQKAKLQKHVATTTAAVPGVLVMLLWICGWIYDVIDMAM